MDELIQELIHLGLSEKEAAVYLASLELGPAAVQDIAHKAKVNRATTYVMIEALTSRGLISTFVKGKKRYFVPETPERLLSIVRLQRKELEEKEGELAKALPMLLALFNVEGAKPQIRYLEGPEGLETVREIFLSLSGESVQIVPYSDVQSIEELIKGHHEHTRRFVEQKAPYRTLLVVKKDAPVDVPVLEHGQVHLIPEEKFPIHGEITVRANHVFLYSYKSAVLSVVIISKEIADAVRALFNLAWEGAAAYPKKTS